MLGSPCSLLYPAHLLMVTGHCAQCLHQPTRALWRRNGPHLPHTSLKRGYAHDKVHLNLQILHNFSGTTQQDSPTKCNDLLKCNSRKGNKSFKGLQETTTITNNNLANIRANGQDAGVPSAPISVTFFRPLNIFASVVSVTWKGLPQDLYSTESGSVRHSSVNANAVSSKQSPWSPCFTFFSALTGILKYLFVGVLLSVFSQPAWKLL